VPESARRLQHQASLRYEHQGFELFVPWTSPGITEAGMAATIQAFHGMHERLYTFSQEDTPVEIVTLGIAAEGVFPPPKLEELAPGGAIADAITARKRPGPMPRL
jgi:N-methylhydantoinase A